MGCWISIQNFKTYYMQKHWIESLPGIPPLPPCPEGYARPDRFTATFIEEGHFVEYFEYPFDRNRTIALFYGPGEFIIRAHPKFSTIQALDRSCVADFSHDDIFRTLRNYPESRIHYRKLREAYRQKIVNRLRLAALSCPLEKLGFVQETQRWVLRVAPDHLLAGYLEIPLETLKSIL
jgi:hypothetical protein